MHQNACPSFRYLGPAGVLCSDSVCQRRLPQVPHAIFCGTPSFGQLPTRISIETLLLQEERENPLTRGGLLPARSPRCPTKVSNGCRWREAAEAIRRGEGCRCPRFKGARHLLRVRSEGQRAADFHACKCQESGWPAAYLCLIRVPLGSSAAGCKEKPDLRWRSSQRCCWRGAARPGGGDVRLLLAPTGLGTWRTRPPRQEMRLRLGNALTLVACLSAVFSFTWYAARSGNGGEKRTGVGGNSPPKGALQSLARARSKVWGGLGANFFRRKRGEGGGGGVLKFHLSPLRRSSAALFKAARRKAGAPWAARAP